MKEGSNILRDAKFSYDEYSNLNVTDCMIWQKHGVWVTFHAVPRSSVIAPRLFELLNDVNETYDIETEMRPRRHSLHTETRPRRKRSKMSRLETETFN